MGLNVEELKAKVLDLAIRGKLVPQDEAEGTAQDLLKQIEKERRQHTKTTKSIFVKVENDFEGPFDIPDNWKWIFLPQIVSVGGIFTDGDWVESKDQDPNGEVRLIQLADIGEGFFKNKSNRYLSTTKAIELKCTFLKEGDMLISRLQHPLGRSCLFPLMAKGKYATVVDISIIRTQAVNLHYFVYMLNSSYWLSSCVEYASGTTRSRISKSNFMKIPLSLPPLAEQHRIVQKVDELFTLLDSLNREVKSSTDLLAVLKNKTLDLAIRGKLVLQDESDGTAHELLEKIKAEKEKLVQEKKIKKQEALPPVMDEDIPFEIPESWCWVRLKDFVVLKSGKVPPVCGLLSQGTYPYVKVGDMNLIENRIEITTSSCFIDKYIPNDIISTGSIIFPKRGGAISTNKKKKVISDIYIDTNTMAMKSILFDLSKYLFVWFLQLDLWKLNSGTTIPQINNQDIEPLLFPLPPLEEQHRIVRKVDSIMALIQEMEVDLNRKTVAVTNSVPNESGLSNISLQEGRAVTE